MSELRDWTDDGIEDSVDACHEGFLGTLEGSKETAATADERVSPAVREGAHIRIGSLRKELELTL